MKQYVVNIFSVLLILFCSSLVDIVSFGYLTTSLFLGIYIVSILFFQYYQQSYKEEYSSWLNLCWDPWCIFCFFSKFLEASVFGVRVCFNVFVLNTHTQFLSRRFVPIHTHSSLISCPLTSIIISSIIYQLENETDDLIFICCS